MFRASSYKDFSNIVPKPDHIADLERRQQALEDEIEEAMLHCSTDDLMIVDPVSYTHLTLPTNREV